ncbi:DUF1302 domain-containing protein [Noviherbaspirillum sedimenti]|uniref:DUF1302 family protein n=1 Tax=Noviherbaspirillum sedimenti TaxID=2320865 RepID=A0A3A3FWM7_9BURK|nr:DUF1302 family protein [Noviherbaspirillum sedimenti]RJG00623.1 DUF1302 family protein [Noviherbaspirillum sedimenti]
MKNTRRNAGDKAVKVFKQNSRMARFGGALGLLAIASTASAVEFSTGNPDLTIRWDNSIRYNLGARIEGRDARIANNAGSDEGDFKFGEGSITTNRLDLLSEVEVDWKQQMGFRVSGTAWGDHAYRDTHVRQNPALVGALSSYNNAEYSSHTKRYYRGLSGELLDAFAYFNTYVDDRPLGVRLGRHALYWGAALFTNGGVSFNQNPIDARKGVSSPGIEAREVQLPLSQLSASLQVTPTVSVAGQYFFDWEAIHSPEGGTFLAGSDATLKGPDRLGGAAAFPANSPELGPEHKSGNWGVNAKIMVPEMNGTTFGVYYRKFDEKNTPWVLRNPAAPLFYRAVYARDTKLVGVSMDTTVAGASIGAEVSYRMDGSLLSQGFALANEGARGDTWHALVNAVYGLKSNALWDAGSISAELTYDRLGKVTKNANLFNREGSALCPLGKFAGCATDDAWGFAMRFAPQWVQVWPSVDLTVPFFVSAGLKGNSPSTLGVYQGAMSYSIGAELDIQRKYNVALTVADSKAKIIPNGGTNVLGPTYTGNGSGWQTTDRRRVMLTFKTAF